MGYTILRNCRVFDGIEAEIQEGVDVVIEAGTIADITCAASARRADVVLDVAGRTVMPGLIDAHVHVCAHEANLTTNESVPLPLRVLHARQFMEASLQRGFTSLRDAGGADHHIAAALELGLIHGPRLFYSGLALSQTGGHGDFRSWNEGVSCACAMHAGAISVIADGVDAVRRAAREQLRTGATQIKIMASGGAASSSDPIWMLQYSDEEILAAVAEAGRKRTYVMAHAYSAEAIARCVALGVRSIEHGNFIDSPTARQIANAGAFVVPTLATYFALSSSGEQHGWRASNLAKIAEVRDRGLAALEICKAAGARMGFGTDLLGQLHVHQHEEFNIRAQVLTPLEVLASATSVNGELLQAGGKLGVIRQGACADLIVVDGDPLRDLAVFTDDGRNVPVVMKGGRVMKNLLH